MHATATYEKPMAMDNMQPAATGLRHLSPGQAMLLPGTFIAGLFALGYYVGAWTVVSLSILGAGAALLIWTAFLYVSALRSQRTLQLEVMLFKHHWVQALTQVVIYAFLAWYIPTIRGLWPLLLAQLLFAYGFHVLLTWSRRDHYGLGFGPVPITGSFNLFILFRPEWFFWQFGIVATAFLGKELIRWERNGRSTHIFNPSSFGLFVFSMILIATGTTDTTLGVEIASWLSYAPNVYLVLFVVSIPVQLLFGVATMTAAAFATVYLFGLGYFALTGTYYFFDAYIPVAVFVGMLLLITDPATSPRTESGRILFGALYGLGIVVAFALLRAGNAPGFYEKLLPVPFLNLLVPRIDRAAEAGKLALLDFSNVGRDLSRSARRAAIVGIWACIFLVAVGAKGVGDEHPGQWVPFWQQACAEGSARACDHLATVEQNLCLAGSGWACNELGILLPELDIPRSEIGGALRYGCDAGFETACSNAVRFDLGSLDFERAPPPASELPLLLKGSKRPLPEMEPEALYALACKRGFSQLCGSG